MASVSAAASYQPRARPRRRASTMPMPATRSRAAMWRAATVATGASPRPNNRPTGRGATSPREPSAMRPYAYARSAPGRAPTATGPSATGGGEVLGEVEDGLGPGLEGRCGLGQEAAGLGAVLVSEGLGVQAPLDERSVRIGGVDRPAPAVVDLGDVEAET